MPARGVRASLWQDPGCCLCPEQQCAQGRLSCGTGSSLPPQPFKGLMAAPGFQLILVVRGRGRSTPTGTADRGCGAIAGAGSALAPRHCLMLEVCRCPATWLKMFFPSSLLLSAAPAFGPTGLTAPSPRRCESNCSLQRSPKLVVLHSSSVGSCQDLPTLPHPSSSSCLSSSGCGGFAPWLPMSSLTATQVSLRHGWKRLHPLLLLQGPSEPTQPPLPCSLPAPLWVTSGSALAAGAPFPAQCSNRVAHCPQSPLAADGRVRHRESCSWWRRDLSVAGADSALSSAARGWAGKGALVNQPVTLPAQGAGHVGGDSCIV